ncbi:TPA: hypothetical protein O0C67_003240 [Legionella pneumophila]|nr:hypothetical protein [Legionella pneumophila]HCX7831863.1 hypothetical protein [Legionella pneumophila]
MNDFTKEELESLRSSNNLSIGFYELSPIRESIHNKLESMIKNYCEHSWRLSAINAIYCHKCQKHVEYDE